MKGLINEINALLAKHLTQVAKQGETSDLEGELTTGALKLLIPYLSYPQGILLTQRVSCILM